MKSRLIVKLLLVHLVVIGFVLAVVWLAINTLAASYFVTLMQRYHISPKPAQAMFVGAVHRYLIWSCLAAALLAVILSFLIMRRLLAPLTGMTTIAQRIATGDFNGRVPEISVDEVGQLAKAFNKMAASLEQIERLRRSLMIDVAHELRTPLTNMRGYLEALKDGVLPPSVETFGMLHDQTLRLADLVEDVLDLARADAARGYLQRRPVALPALMEQIRELFATRLAQRHIDVRVQIPEQLPPVSADRKRIARVLRNLMDNCLRYTPEGGFLEISMAAANGRVRVALTNTGGEIQPEDLPYLFERFFRGEKSRSRDHGGAGIGLAIVKELVEAHGGTVGAAIDGDRLQIRFDLPVAEDDL